MARRKQNGASGSKASAASERADGPADEVELRRRLVAGDRAAFEYIYARHNSAMIRLCTGILGSHERAEEVVQDAWVAVLNSIAGFEGRSSLAGWIFRIAVNKARSRAKREGRVLAVDPATLAGDGLEGAFDARGHWAEPPRLWDEVTPERVVAGRDVLAHVQAAIDVLPPMQRAVLILRSQQGLGSDEICGILDISPANMRVLLHRARLILRARLDELV